MKTPEELEQTIAELQAKVADQEKRIKALEEKENPPDIPRNFVPSFR